MYLDCLTDKLSADNVHDKLSNGPWTPDNDAKFRKEFSSLKVLSVRLQPSLMLIIDRKSRPPPLFFK